MLASWVLYLDWQGRTNAKNARKVTVGMTAFQMIDVMGMPDQVTVQVSGTKPGVRYMYRSPLFSSGEITFTATDNNVISDIKLIE